jgi:hypothetical protein
VISVRFTFAAKTPLSQSFFAKTVSLIARFPLVKSANSLPENALTDFTKNFTNAKGVQGNAQLSLEIGLLHRDRRAQE